MLTIKIKYFNDKLEKVAKITKGNWIDLRAAEDVALKAGEFKLIPLGIAMELPRVASSAGLEEFKYLAGIMTSVSTLSPYLKTLPVAFM